METPQGAAPRRTRWKWLALALAGLLAGAVMFVVSERPPKVVAAISPANICGLNGVARGSDLVSIGGEIVPRSLLSRPPGTAEEASTPQAAILRAWINSPESGGDLPKVGWNLLVDRPDRTVFIVIAHGLPTTVAVTKTDGQWAWAGQGGGLPQPTPGQRGSGLELSWRGPMTDARGSSNTMLVLTNGRSSEWVDDQGQYWGVAHVFDQTTQKPVGSSDVAIGGVGETYHLRPGGSTTLPVALPQGIPPGTYDLIACVPELALASPIGILLVPGSS